MRKIAFPVLSFFIFISVILAQKIIENPEKPKSKDAGRIVKLKEMMRIRDDGKEIALKGPYDLQIGFAGSIYFYDYWKLYKFDNNGNLIFKIIKQGQGPGEANRRTSCMLTKNEIIVQAGSPPKFMRFDFQGEYLGETRTQMTHVYKFLEQINNKNYGFLEEIKIEELGKEGYVDFYTSLYEISSDFSKHKKKYSFPIRYYVIKSAWWPRARFDYVINELQALFISHTPEYQIVKFNLEKNMIEKIFKRKYKRVKYPSQPKRKGPPGALSPPPHKYYLDIGKLLIQKDLLWVVTSTRDKQKNRLIDVYNMEGNYIDNFYLQFPENINPRNFGYGIIALEAGYLYSVDEHSDGYFSIAKYKVLDNE